MYSDEALEHWITLATTEFYELVYKDEWLKDVFASVPQDFITSQQIDFMVSLMGGPKRFSGRHAKDAHPHIYITEEMWEAREGLLKQAFKNVKCPEDLQEKWLKIDEAFKRHIVMTSPAQCEKRYPGDEIIIVPKPKSRAA